MRLYEERAENFAQYVKEYYEAIFVDALTDWDDDQRYFRVPPSITDDFKLWEETDEMIERNYGGRE